MTQSKAHSEQTEGELWFESAGTRLFARSLGEGNPIVFLHGGLADHRASLLYTGGLASSFRLLLPDLRASGCSVFAGELSWDLLADDVLALLTHAGVSRAVIGGTSAGAGVALRFALRHREHARGLLLMRPAFAGSEQGLNAAQTRAMQGMDAYGQRALREGVQVLSELYQRLPDALRERALEMMRGFEAASVAATTRFLASGQQPFASNAELAALDLPCLLVPGSDPEHPAEVAALYACALPRAELLQPDDPAIEQRVRAFCAACFG